MLESEGAKLGARLRKRAEDKKVSAKRIAEACGVTSSAVYGWFADGRLHKRHLPTLAGLLDWSIDEIVSDVPAVARTAHVKLSSAAVHLGALFDHLPEQKRREAWPWLVRMLAQRERSLENFLPYPVATVGSTSKKRRGRDDEATRANISSNVIVMFGRRHDDRNLESKSKGKE